MVGGIRCSNLLFLFLLILFLFHLFIVKEQVTNDFAIVKSTKQHANFINIPIPFVNIHFEKVNINDFVNQFNEIKYDFVI